MKKISFIIVLLCFIHHAYSQGVNDEGTWNLLMNDVKVKYTYSIKYDALLPKAKFGDRLQNLNGKVITISGFYMPVDMTGDVFVLSYNPSNMCFFCNGAGIETIIELYPKEEEIRRFSRLATDNYFEIKGKLKLNANDFEHLIYIMEDVEFVRLLKN